MMKLALLALVVPSLALAQLVVGVSSVGRPDISSLNVGEDVQPTKEYDEGVPVEDNLVYTDGTPWNASDTFPSGFEDNYSMQIVTDQDDLTEDGASYLTFTTSRASAVYVCRDDDNSQAYAAGWTDTGLDVVRTDATFSCLTKSFAEGSVSVPGNDGDAGTEQYIVFVRDALKAVSIEASAGAGAIAFVDVSYSMNEEATLTFYVERTGGTAGAASVDVICKTSPTCKGTLNTESFTWLNGIGGQKSGTFTANDISGDGISELELALSGGSASVSTTDLSIFITDLDVAPSAITYYVNPDDGSCSDTGDGLARTSGGGMEPWCTISRANSVAHPSVAGHATVYIENQNYRNQPIVPANSGLSATQNIRYCAIGGDVYLLGPSSGAVLNAINVAAARSYITIGGCDSNRIIVDGEVVFGAGGGQVEKNEDPSSVAHILQGGEIYGDYITIDVDHRRTAGWAGFYVDTANALNPTLRINTSQHGTPFFGDGQDFGDTFWIEGTTSSNVLLMDGGSTGRTQYLGGHSAGHYTDGQVVIRGHAFKGSWGAVSTFSNTNPDGNRAITLTRRIESSHVHDAVFNGSGRPADQQWVECFKQEATRTTVSNSWVRNCQGWAVVGSAADWSGYARGMRTAHVVFENIAGPVALIEDWGNGAAALNDVQYKNIIVKDYSTSATCCGSSEWVELFVFRLTGSQTLESIGFRVDGMTIETTSGNCNAVYVSAYGGGNAGSWTLAQLEAIYPNVFNNVTCTTDVQLDSLPSASTDVAVPSMAAYLALDVADTTSLGTGVWLTTASNSGTSSTNLCVADVQWFQIPASVGVPGVGQWSGGYDVRIQGGGSNTVYTAASLTDATGTDGCITLSTARTWSAGAGVGYGMSGAAPNRGYVR